ncbi:acyl-CoA synthetase (AMP-forming)/AMP-acid ligase II [Allocatelliglobosispora scoriae]|uniref:Acyl-CoA synthetase (AMP-forming)/AMP-acid ligase II n=1 Tax=Allocatelliglobosispora scoriae TaxID=643052 RepID=A0A841BCA5_9ACTN|nr:AMP-binding protein [Allocatelliglobosispora scoriae]MBB5866737.1 acyl-CoA synthetase (AMP-forming)/AMP-acid ligase II [Allocatelliglobosispora scoriae]
MTQLLSPGARLVDGATGEVLNGPALTDAIAATAGEIVALPGGLILLPAPWRTRVVLRYLAAIGTHRPIALLDPGLPAEKVRELVARFAPAIVWGPEEFTTYPGPVPDGYRPSPQGWIRAAPAAPTHPDLAVLLTTSGSTGSARLVRLSRAAVLANAAAIADTLRIGPTELAPTSMPFFFGYGLSVLNSHLCGGAGVVVTDESVMSGPFWDIVDSHGCTSLAAVPHIYELLHRLHWTPARHPTLRTLTQSGGRMRPDLISSLAGQLEPRNGSLYVMYGQTEATARLAVLPPDRLLDKIGSVGLAIPGSRLSIRDDAVTGEVIFRGPAVMMGYADTVTDLARGDDLHGVLATGDLGSFDSDGYLYLHGRLKRIAKVLGVRVSLDDVERIAGHSHPPGAVAAVAADDTVVLWCEGEPTGDVLRDITRRVAAELRLNRHGFQARAITTLPLLPNGKVDYRTLGGQA